MYAALNQNGKLEYAVTVTQPSECYICPYCRQRVYLKKSRRGKNFFAHQTACAHTKEKQMFGETNRHKLGKSLLLKAHSKAICEHWLANINQQVDVWVPIKEPIIFEFQYSKVSANNLRLRQNAYLQETNRIYWMGDDSYWKKDKLTCWQKMLVHFHYADGYQWYVLNLKKKQLVIYSQLPIIYSALYWQCNVRQINLKEGWLNEFLCREKGRVQTFIKKKHQMNQRYLQAIMLGEKYRPLMMRLAQKQFTLTDLPQWFFTMHWQCLLVEQPVWYYMIVVWLYFQENEQSYISDEQLRLYLYEQMEQGWLKLVDLPFIQKDTLSDLVNATLACFTHYGVLKRVSRFQWCIVQ